MSQCWVLRLSHGKELVFVDDRGPAVEAAGEPLRGRNPRSNLYRETPLAEN